MKVYLLKFYSHGEQSGDTLVFRTRRNAIQRFNLIKQRMESLSSKTRYVNNEDKHLGNEMIMAFYYDRGGCDDCYKLTQQVTED